MSNKLEDLKNQIKSAQVSISTTWTVTHNHMAKEIEDELSRILQEEIDNIALYEIYIGQGWYGFQKDHTQEWPVEEVTEWLKNNCTGAYYHKPGLCAFEKREDATKFNLTWC